MEGYGYTIRFICMNDSFVFMSSHCISLKQIWSLVLYCVSLHHMGLSTQNENKTVPSIWNSMPWIDTFGSNKVHANKNMTLFKTVLCQISLKISSFIDQT